VLSTTVTDTTRSQNTPSVTARLATLDRLRPVCILAAMAIGSRLGRDVTRGSR
jgi:hypothetical protein